MADITYYAKKETLNAFGRDIEVSNFVRLNRTGAPIFTRNNEAVKPQQFPLGRWKATDPLTRTASDLAPWYIPTDAWQMAEEWSLTKSGFYYKPTGRLVRADAYGIHYSELDFTWGCIRVCVMADLVWLVTQIQETLNEIAKVNPNARWISLEAL
jgi:hypothetical protein